ncbi:MAG: hypothetical protein SPL15_07060 [Lachnospiraceae bacterium]|nr:hypothetical protein [Lachnospiraceae bacterium]MDY5742736.1 hypothetical protein [Lachnospiraceae bacterium]
MARRNELNVISLEGNTLRKMEPMRRPKSGLTAAPLRQPKPVKTVTEDLTTYRNKHRAMQMDRSYLRAVMLTVIICLASIVMPIQMMAQTHHARTTLGQREAQYQQIKEDNDSAYNNLMSSVNYNEIRERAINEFGMQYPTAEQVVLYDGAESNFVRQTQNVTSNH